MYENQKFVSAQGTPLKQYKKCQEIKNVVFKYLPNLKIPKIRIE